MVCWEFYISEGSPNNILECQLCIFLLYAAVTVEQCHSTHLSYRSTFNVVHAYINIGSVGGKLQ